MKAMYGFFCFTLWFAGLDSSFCYIEGLVTNFLDLMNENRMDGKSLMKRALVGAIVCIMGICITAALTTNFGWVLFDMIEHYVADYLIVPVGLLQCVCVGW
jgi:SNF family Na+-dependent transporter